MIQPASRVLALSPHPGDAVLGCGAMLAGASDALVCILFTGYPEDAATTDWDKRCGFSNAREAMTARLAEDDAALDVIGATPVRLRFGDSTYATPTRAAIADALIHVVQTHRPHVLLIPLGLFYSDREVAHLAACDAWFSDSALSCIAYEEGMVRRKRGLVQRRLVDLHARGIDATPFDDGDAQPFETERRHARKREAVSAYASQLKGFGPDGYDDVFLAERLWQLDRQPEYSEVRS